MTRITGVSSLDIRFPASRALAGRTCIVRGAAYVAPEAPGYSITMKPASPDSVRFRD